MRCLHINIRQATFIILSIIVSNVNVIQTADGTEESTSEKTTKTRNNQNEDLTLPCPSDVKCKDLHPLCLNCKFDEDCIYGESISVNCTPHKNVNCFEDKEFERQLICRYCYQTESWEHDCELRANCNSIASPRAFYTTNCTVKDSVLCFGQRTFNKNVLCNWTGGYRWTTALILSVTLGGFGADRFYLGHWQEGIGKLFSFGGLGVWTIIDVILISLHYLGPADGSLYI